MSETPRGRSRYGKAGPVTCLLWDDMITEVMTLSPFPLAIWKAVYRDMSMEKLALPLYSCHR